GLLSHNRTYRNTRRRDPPRSLSRSCATRSRFTFIDAPRADAARGPCRRARGWARTVSRMEPLPHLTGGCMTMKEFTRPEMIEISAELLENGPIIFGKHSLLEVGVEAVRKAHDALLETEKRDSVVTQLVAVLTEEITSDDSHYDRKGRGIYWALNAGAEMSDEPTRAVRFVEVRDLIFPNGLNIIRSSYREQAGAAREL